MSDDYTPADEKALALNYALTALIKTLVDANVIERDHLFTNLAGARAKRLKESAKQARLSCSVR